MKQNFIPSLGLTLPVLGFGGMRLPIDESTKAIDYNHAKQMLDYALRHGVNYFDTAYMYHEGTSEAFFGKALSEYPRESYFLATKMPAGMLKEPADAERIFAEQLAQCNVNYFDFYLLHSVTQKSYANAELLNTIPFLQKMKSEGKIRHLGFSFHDKPALLKNVIAAHPWDFVQLQLNYYDYALGEAKELYEIALRANLPVFVMEPVRGGFLANLPTEAEAILKEANPNKSTAAFALEWVASLTGVAITLSGMSSMDQIKENIATLAEFSAQKQSEADAVLHAADFLVNYKTVPCTGCRYCMPCPAGVNIPEVFSVYNEYKLTKNKFESKFAYGRIAEAEKPTFCTYCRACVSACPQQISIPELLAKAHEELSAL